MIRDHVWLYHPAVVLVLFVAVIGCFLGLTVAYYAGVL